MAEQAFWYGNAKRRAFLAQMDYLADTVKMALLDDTYVADQDAHEQFSDVSASEISGTGYTAGGEALTTKTLVYDAASNQVRLGADNVTWTNATITARFAVIYDDTHVDQPLLAYVDFGENKSSSDGDFQVELTNARWGEVEADAPA